MVEDVVSNTVPQATRQAKTGGKTLVNGEAQTSAKKSASTKASGRPASRHRLMLHLMIGFFMTAIAIAGYGYFGHRATSTDKAGHRLFDFTTHVAAAASDPQTAGSQAASASLPTETTISSVTNNEASMAELLRLQAEMDEMTRRMNALLAAESSFNGVSGTGESIQNNALTGSDTDELLSRLDQMTSMLHDMMSRMDSMSSQTGSPGGQQNHSGHH